ncbi:MAG: superoxide dismutase family protein [Vicinamibacterales bacterium]
MPSGGEAFTAKDALTAKAAMQDRSGRNVGDAALRDTPHGVLLKVDLRGVQPGIHAFHIHETGRCDAPQFSSAGGHFAPEGHQHGVLNPSGAHAGDLPNVHVLAAGDVSFEYLVPGATLRPGTSTSLLDQDGSALVMHAGADDYRTDPSGGAGDRLICGVVMH